MNDLIAFTRVNTPDGKRAIEVELTIDGANKLNDNELNIYQAWNGFKHTFSPDEKQIYTLVKIPTQKEPIKADAYTLNVDCENCFKGLINEWTLNHSRRFTFIKDNNSITMAEVNLKLEAFKWADNCNNTLYDEVVKIQKRHQKVAEGFSKLREAIQVFEDSGTTKDREYVDLLSDLSDHIESELDFCIEKMNLVKLISKNDFLSPLLIKELYDDFIKDKN